MTLTRVIATTADDAKYFATSPRRTFVRVLWGEAGAGSRWHKILDVDVHSQLQHKFIITMPPVMNYVFGQENFDRLSSLGFNCRLVSTHPRPHANGTPSSDHAWQHKVEGWIAALGDFQEIVAMDWDIQPCIWDDNNLRRINSDAVFDSLRKKPDFGACLIRYKRNVSPWRGRRHDGNCRPSAAFCYVPNRRTAEEIQQAWRHVRDTHNNSTEETAISWWIDQLIGGWKGVDYWCERFEAECCLCPRMRGIPDAFAVSKKGVFTF